MRNSGPTLIDYGDENNDDDVTQVNGFPPPAKSKQPQHSVELIFGDMRARASGAGIVMGRAPDVDVKIPDVAVSRRHCRVWRDGDQFMVEDLGSTHGTFVNDVRVEGVVSVTVSDILRLGRVEVSLADLRL
jgi:pSer/pThr/pTyr-binding forkhead associated (FHA) protein